MGKKIVKLQDTEVEKTTSGFEYHGITCTCPDCQDIHECQCEILSEEEAKQLII